MTLFVNYEEIIIIKVLDRLVCMYVTAWMLNEVFLQVSLVKIENQTAQFVLQLPIVLRWTSVFIHKLCWIDQN